MEEKELMELKERFNVEKQENYKPSPIYDIQKIPVDDIVSQRTNMNSLTSKSFDALQVSVRNTGYTMPVNVVNNLLYDESTVGMEKPDLLDVSDGNETMIENSADADGKTVGTQVSDDEIARFFKYRIIDGSHRTLLIRLGKYWFEHGFDKSEAWAAGEIPQEPGNELLAFISWRENFSVPCVVQILPEELQLSGTVLLNSARGTHDLDSMKDIVYNLVSIAGMSVQWVARNLYLDETAVNRLLQLTGFVTKAEDSDNSLEELSWSPETQERWKSVEEIQRAKDGSAKVIEGSLEFKDEGGKKKDITYKYM